MYNLFFDNKFQYVVSVGDNKNYSPTKGEYHRLSPIVDVFSALSGSVGELDMTI
jgi:hypothetical protein